MRELAVAQREVLDEQGIIHIYDYSVLIGEMEILEEFSCESYGVRIQERGGGCSEVPNITVSASRVDELVELLVKNTVTPCTLRDVIDDWL